jgi:uncharacterized protein (DUF4213/DUF364 family)
MDVLSALIDTLPAGRVLRVHLGLLWTAVVVEVDGAPRCGLAATLRSDEHHARTGEPDVRRAGALVSLSSHELASLALSSHPTEASIGLAAINALLPPPPPPYDRSAAADFIARGGPDQRVAVVGHFPFTEALRARVRTLWVLELNPRGDDLPADAAPEVIPHADAVAITATTLINRTFDGLLALCRPGTQVLLVGPSTPLAPRLFDFGVTALCGAHVEAIDPVLRGVAEGASFKQLRPLGVDYVTLAKA